MVRRWRFLYTPASSPNSARSAPWPKELCEVFASLCCFASILERTPHKKGTHLR
jgi:hypothetical protein